jgi:hypothetical protein
MLIRRLIEWPSNWTLRPQYCKAFGKGFLVVAFLGLASQIVYDQHPITAVSLFPQWLLLGAIWYLWRQDIGVKANEARRTLVFALLIPALSFLTLLVAWLAWKANTLAICGVVPISDAASYYISAQTFLRETFLDAAAQRRPLNVVLTALWLYLSGDHFKLSLLIQALAFSAAAFLASTVVAAVHGFRAGLLLFSLLLIFAEPYLPTTLSETNGIIFGILSLVGFLFGLYRRKFLPYCFGALFLAVGLAIRPSALFVLPCVVVAGAMIFDDSRIKRLAVIVCLTSAVLLPSGISILLNKTMSHGDGGFNANISYSVYGLVTGGKGWEQYERDNPRALYGLPEAERSHVILEASKQYFEAHPLDLVRGLIKSQVLGPLQTFSQMARLAFLGAAGDPLRIIPPAAIIVISLYFAGVLWCQLVSKRHVVTINGDLRLFCLWFLLGYLISIPFFYKDGGLRLHAAVLPIISYMLVWVLLPPAAATDNVLSSSNADRLLAGTTVFGFLILGLLSWISLAHPTSHQFEPIPVSKTLEGSKIAFRFKPGWPRCDLRNFEHVRGVDKPHWFSGAIPDDDYRSAGLREISGRGELYFGFDAGARVWKIIHTDKPVGLLNGVEIGSASHNGYPDNKYRDFYSAESVQIIGAK